MLKNKKIIYLDNLRAGAMLLGVFVHATTVADFGKWQLINIFSDYFRMATFFFISGFFSCLLYKKGGTRVFLSGRLPVLFFPLLTGLFILNPLTLLFVFNHHNDIPGLDGGGVVWKTALASFGLDDNFEGPLVWHLHLWFLISLSVYIIATPCLVVFIGKFAERFASNKWIQACAAKISLFALCLLIGFLAVLSRAIYVVFVEPVYASWLVRTTIEYIPYFTLGLILFLNPVLFNRFHKIDYASMCVGLTLVFISYYMVGVGVDGRSAEGLRIFGQGVIRCASIFSLLFLFRRFLDFSERWMSKVTDATYSVYILHFLVIYLLAFFFPSEGMGGWYLILISLLAIVICFFLHRLLKKNAFFRMLLNGKR